MIETKDLTERDKAMVMRGVIGCNGPMQILLRTDPILKDKLTKEELDKVQDRIVSYFSGEIDHIGEPLSSNSPYHEYNRAYKKFLY